MGCWNATDYISKLPICYGEDVVVILVRETAAKQDKSPHTCYAADAYVPFGYPIYGKYDEYGGIEKIENADDVIEYLNTVKIYYPDGDIMNITRDNLENSINDILSSGCTVEEEKMPLEGFFVFRDLYKLLIDEVSSRKPYNKDETIAHQFERLLEKRIKDFRESDRYLNILSKCGNEDERNDYTFGLMSFGDLSRFGTLSSFSDRRWEISSYIKLKLVKDHDEKLAASLTELIMFKTVLDSLRMGYFCITGDGSQSREMYLHTLVAKYVLDYASKDYAENCDDKDMTKKEYLSETMFGYYEN